MIIDHKSKNQLIIINTALFYIRMTTIDLKIDNLDRVSIPTKIVATFDVEHPIHGTDLGSSFGTISGPMFFGF